MRKGPLLFPLGLLSRETAASIADHPDGRACQNFWSRRGGRVVDCTGLLSRRTVRGTEGSNPSLSATFTNLAALIGLLVNNHLLSRGFRPEVVDPARGSFE